MTADDDKQEDTTNSKIATDESLLVYEAANGEKIQYQQLAGWHDFAQAKEANPFSKFALTNGICFFNVIVDDAADITSFETYKSLVLPQLKAQLGSEFETEPITLNNLNGVQFNVSSEIQGVKLHYIIYLLESEKNFSKS